MILINNKPVVVKSFPDGTPLLHIDYIPSNEITITWKFESMSEMATLMFVNSHLRQRFKTYCVRLDMPYIPNARQDRVKTMSDVFTLKYFAQFINSLRFDSVHVLDPHSHVSEALFDNLVVETSKTLINIALKKVKERENSVSPVIYFPDEGAMKRYSELVDAPYLFGVKQRDWFTGDIKGLTLQGDLTKVVDNPVLIVDDICSKGGTFYYSAKALKEAGAANIYLYVTHCEDTIFQGKLLDSDFITHIYTTDSILFGEHEKITKILI